MESSHPMGGNCVVKEPKYGILKPDDIMGCGHHVTVYPTKSISRILIYCVLFDLFIWIIHPDSIQYILFNLYSFRIWL